MASLSKTSSGAWFIQFRTEGRKRETIHLGSMSKSAAMLARSHVAHIRSAGKSGDAIPEATAAWIKGVGDDLHAKLVKAGLVPSRSERKQLGLGAMLDSYIKGRTDLKERSRINLTQARRTMVEFFGETRDPRTINKGEARDWAIKLKGTLAPPTISAHVKRARQIFRDAIDRNYVTINPFVGIKLGSEVNESRNRYIPALSITAVIDACPDAEWRLIFALARFCGLRTPSEIRTLKWTDVNFETGRMTVHAPKTEHHEGKDKRTIPIFPQVLPYLRECFEQADDGAVHVIAKHRGENLRTQAERIIKKTGLVQWPRLFQNLRASCETDLMVDHPIHVVCAWIGNSELIAARHYLQVTDRDFDRAAKSAALSGLQVPSALIENRDNAHGNSETASNHTLDRGRTTHQYPLELVNWGEKALQKALHQIKSAAEVMRKRDIRFVRVALALSTADPASLLSNPGPSLPYLPASPVPARAVKGGA